LKISRATILYTIHRYEEKIFWWHKTDRQEDHLNWITSAKSTTDQYAKTTTMFLRINHKFKGISLTYTPTHNYTWFCRDSSSDIQFIPNIRNLLSSVRFCFQLIELSCAQLLAVQFRWSSWPFCVTKKIPSS